MAIILNDNIDTRANKPTDNRFGPFDTVPLALAAVTTYQRYRGLTIGIGNPLVVEYWFNDGILDGDFVPKTASGNLTGITAGTGIAVSGTATNPTIAVTTPTQLTTNLSTNIITDASNAVKYPNVPAVKTYVDSFLVSVINDRGNFTPSSTSPGIYPSTGGSGTPPGTIVKGDLWFINFAPGQTTGYLGTSPVQIGTSVRALVDSPSPTTATDWDILDAGLGYIPEDSANRVLDVSGILAAPNSPTNYPSVKALTEYLTTFTPSVPTLQQVVSSAVGANISTGVNLVVRNTSTPTRISSVSSGSISITDSDTSRSIVLGTDDRIRVQVGNNFTTYEATQITFNGPGYTSTLQAQSGNQIMYLPSPPSAFRTLALSVNGNFADTSGNITFNPASSGTAYRIPRVNVGATNFENSDIYNESSRVRIFATTDRGMIANSVQVGDSSGDMSLIGNCFVIESNTLPYVGIYGTNAGPSQLAASLELGLSSSPYTSFSQVVLGNENSPSFSNNKFLINHAIRDINGNITSESTPLLIYADGRIEMNAATTSTFTGRPKLAIGTSVTSLPSATVLHAQGNARVTGDITVGGTVFIQGGSINITNIPAGSSNSVITESAGTFQKRTIDSRVWGSSIVSTSLTPTAGRLARWTASNTVANSIIQDNGSRIGIGTAPDSTELMTIGGNLLLGEIGVPSDNDSYAIKLQGKGTTGTNQTGEIKIDASGTAATQGCLQIGTSGFIRFAAPATGSYVFQGSPAVLSNNSGGISLFATTTSTGIVLRNTTGQTSGKLLSVVNAGLNEPITVLASSGTEGNVGINIATPQRSLHINDVMRLEPRASAPTSPSAGDIYYDSTVNKLRIYNGTSWRYVQFEP